MTQHKCNYEDKIHGIHKAIHGNGRPGLIEVVTRLAVSLEKTEENISQMEESVKLWGAYVSEIKGELKAVSERKIAMRWLVGLSVTTLLGMCTVIVTFITSR